MTLKQQVEEWRYCESCLAKFDQQEEETITLEIKEDCDYKKVGFCQNDDCNIIIPLKIDSEIKKDERNLSLSQTNEIRNQLNFFKLFGLKENLNVDLNDLEIKLILKMKQLHPDKFINSSNNDKEIALKNASVYNMAYNTLKNKHELYTYYFKLLGYDYEKQDVREKFAKLPEYQEILMDFMNFQDQIQQNNDSNFNLEIYNEIQTIIIQNINEMIELANNGKLDESFLKYIKLSFLRKLHP